MKNFTFSRKGGGGGAFKKIIILIIIGKHIRLCFKFLQNDTTNGEFDFSQGMGGEENPIPKF